jgi:hypothetical protein
MIRVIRDIDNLNVEDKEKPKTLDANFKVASQVNLQKRHVRYSLELRIFLKKTPNLVSLIAILLRQHIHNSKSKLSESSNNCH